MIISTFSVSPPSLIFIWRRKSAEARQRADILTQQCCIDTAICLYLHSSAKIDAELALDE